MAKITEFKNNDIEEIFLSYPPKVKEKLLLVRELIFSIEKDLDGNIEETLKWGEPSYIINNGSTVRLNKVKGAEDLYGVYFNCKTTLISTFKEKFGDEFKYDGTRGLIFDVEDKIDMANLKHCIYLSLTYFAKK